MKKVNAIPACLPTAFCNGRMDASMWDTEMMPRKLKFPADGVRCSHIETPGGYGHRKNLCCGV